MVKPKMKALISLKNSNLIKTVSGQMMEFDQKVNKNKAAADTALFTSCQITNVNIKGILKTGFLTTQQNPFFLPYQ